MITSQIKAFMDLFHQGKALANAETWKDVQLAGNAITSLLAALIGVTQVFGYDFSFVDRGLLVNIGYGVASLVVVKNMVLNVITDKNRGLKSTPASIAGLQHKPK